MQNSLNKEGNIVEFTPKSAESAQGMTVPEGLMSSPMQKIAPQEVVKSAHVTPLKVKTVYVIKKDGTKELFDIDISPSEIVYQFKKHMEDLEMQYIMETNESF